MSSVLFNVIIADIETRTVHHWNGLTSFTKAEKHILLEFDNHPSLKLCLSVTVIDYLLSIMCTGQMNQYVYIYMVIFFQNLA